MKTSFIYPIVANVGRSLDNETVFIEKIIAPVDAFFAGHFHIDRKVNIIITTSLPWLIIPEDGVGGKTYASDFVVLTINQIDTTAGKVSEMLAHELAHSMRWDKNPEWSRDLFCELVSEGLAVHIEAEFSKTQKNKTFFLKTILQRSDDENRKMFERLKLKFTTRDYDYDGIFFGGKDLPRWVGYSVGYYIVKMYLEKTGRSVFDIIDTPYDEFRKVQRL